MRPRLSDLEEQPAVAARRIGRLEHAEVGREVDPALGVALGLVQVDDRLVRRVLGIDGEPDDAVDPLVRADARRTLAPSANGRRD